MKKVLQQGTILGILGAVLFALQLFAFTEPSSSPPSSNVPAPLHVGSAGQSKSGGLILNTGGAAYGLIIQNGFVGIGTLAPTQKLDVTGNIQFSGALMPNGDAGLSGQILTSQGPGSPPKWVGQPPPPPPPIPHGQVTFSYTGSEQQWVVPIGVTSVTADLRGAQGGAAFGPYDLPSYYNTPILPGYGARIQTTLAVTGGETLYIYVGGAGTNVVRSVAPGGFNGGGSGGSGTTDNSPSGGGASDIRRGGSGSGSRVAVAGGGGGAEIASGGDGGDPQGYDGRGPDCGTVANNPSSPNRGRGGSAGGGGAGGDGCGGGGAGGSGGFGQGGSGGSGNGCGRAAGGGGGGYYGGGGGGGTCTTGGAAGGGGGSSYSAGSGTTYTRGFQQGHGQILITY